MRLFATSGLWQLSLLSLSVSEGLLGVTVMAAHDPHLLPHAPSAAHPTYCQAVFRRLLPAPRVGEKP